MPMTEFYMNISATCYTMSSAFCRLDDKYDKSD